MAENGGFSLAAMLAEIMDGPESGPKREQIVYLDLDLLDEDSENFYATDGIEDLAANIATIGLLDPLRVRPDPENPGRFKVVSGHRRRKALHLLKTDDPEKWGLAPCILEDNAQSSAAQELRLILANKDNRKISSADLLEQAQRVERLLYQLKEEEGIEFPGRMRDHVAEAVGSTKTKLSNLKVIDERLNPCWKPAYRTGTLSEASALILAQMPQEWQRIIFFGKEWRGKIEQKTAKSYKDAFQRIMDIQCPLGLASCGNASQMMTCTVKKNYFGDSCRGCCSDCAEIQKCKFSCLNCEDKKKRIQAEAKENQREKAAARAEAEKPTINFISGVYFRIGKARAQNLVSVRDLYAAGKMMYVSSIDDKKQLDLECGMVKISPNTTLPFGYSFTAALAKNLVAVAEVLGCSIDWLLGRDVPGPGEVPESGTEPEPSASGSSAGWQTGDPEEPGDYAVLTSSDIGGRMFGDICSWDGTRWTGLLSDEIVRFWIPIPETTND